jgi:hypothetical protein
MQILYDQDGFTEHEKQFFQTTIRHNVVESIQTLIAATTERLAIPFQNPV